MAWDPPAAICTYVHPSGSAGMRHLGAARTAAQAAVHRASTPPWQAPAHWPLCLSMKCPLAAATTGVTCAEIPGGQLRARLRAPAEYGTKLS